MTSQDIERMMTFSKEVYQAAEHTLEALHDGEKISLKELAQIVGLALAKNPKDIIGLIEYFAHETTAAYVARGSLVKGVKVVKSGKKNNSVLDINISETNE